MLLLLPPSRYTLTFAREFFFGSELDLHINIDIVLNYEYYRSEYWDFRDITWKSCMGHRGARAVRAEYKYTKIPL